MIDNSGHKVAMNNNVMNGKYMSIGLEGERKPGGHRREIFDGERMGNERDRLRKRGDIEGTEGKKGCELDNCLNNFWWELLGTSFLSFISFLCFKSA